MTGEYQDDAEQASASKPPMLGDHAQTEASRVGGWGTEPPAAEAEKIIIDPGIRDHRQRDRRVVARGKPRREIDERLIIQALLMIAKDLERGNTSGHPPVSEA